MRRRSERGGPLPALVEKRLNMHVPD